MVFPDILGCFDLRKKVGPIFSRLSDSMKGKYCVFRSYKKTNKLYFLYLEWKLQQDSKRSCNFM